MKKRLVLSSAIVALSLLTNGCGGSDSSSPVSSEAPSEPAETQAPANDTTCKTSGDTVLVPEGGECTYSIPSYNNGEVQTYRCEDGRIYSDGLSAQTITFNNITITCE